MTKYLLECGSEHIQVCAGRDNGVDHLRYMGAQRAAKDFAKKKAEGAVYCSWNELRQTTESYAWLLQREKTKGRTVFPVGPLGALEAISFFSLVVSKRFRRRSELQGYG